MQIESNASAARAAVAGQAGTSLPTERPLGETAVHRSPTWVRHNAWRQTTAQAAQAATPTVRHGWFGRLRHVLQGKAQQAQSSSDARLAALSLAPARSHGFGWLRGLSRLGQRLQASVASMKAQQAALADTQALARVTTAMQQRFAAAAGNADSFNATLRQAFGDKFDAAKAETLRQQALAGDFSWAPKIQIATAAQLADLSGTQAADGVARGCYVQAEDTIYIAAETLHGDADTAQRLLMEEMGHAIDARINTSDAVGDEGEIFSKLMHGDAVTAQQMADMKADNDHGTVMLNGRQVQVEYGFFKKLFKAVTGAIKKVVGAVVKGVVNVAKSAVKVTTGLITLNFSRVREGLKEGVQAVVTTVKTVAKAIKDSAKELAKIAKEAFQKLMQSKLFAAVLMVCRFIPIPVVQLVVRIVDIVRAAYMAYQGIKNKSWGAVLGAVASVAGGAANVAGNFGASVSTINAIKGVADAASKLSMAYNAIANKDIGAALSLAGGAFSSGSQASSTIQTLQTVGGYAQQAIALRTAVRSGDALSALSGGLSLAGAAAGNSSYAADIAQASQVVTGLRAAQALGQGNLDAAQALAGSMLAAQEASLAADAITARQQLEARRETETETETETDSTNTAVTARASDEPSTVEATPASDELGNGSAYASGLKASGLPVNDGLASREGTSGGAPAAISTGPATTVITRGDTLEAIARTNYGDQWKAGLAQMAVENKLPLNQWGSPILTVGKDLIVPDLSTKTDDELTGLSKLGGKIIAQNSNGLAVKAELEQRARDAAAAKIAEANSAVRQATVPSDTSTAPRANGAQTSTPPESGNSLASGRASMNAYWSDVADAGVKEGSFVKYLAGQSMQKLGNVGYGLAEMGQAVSQRPDQALVGGGKSLVNLGPDAFNTATHLVKTSADGYTMLAEQLGAGEGSLAGFRNSKPLQITPLATYDNPAQAGGALLTQAAVGAGLAKYGNHRIEPNLGTPGTLYSNPIPVKLVAPEAAVDTAVLTGPVAFRPPPGATAEEIAQMQRYVDGSNEALASGYLSNSGRVSTTGQLRTDASLAAARERSRAKAAGEIYQGHAGHVPDTTWTGVAQPYQWLDLTPKVNSSLGGQVKNYPVGYKPTEFTLEKP